MKSIMKPFKHVCFVFLREIRSWELEVDEFTLNRGAFIQVQPCLFIFGFHQLWFPKRLSDLNTNRLTLLLLREFLCWLGRKAANRHVFFFGLFALWRAWQCGTRRGMLFFVVKRLWFPWREEINWPIFAGSWDIFVFLAHFNSKIIGFLYKQQARLFFHFLLLLFSQKSSFAN